MTTFQQCLESFSGNVQQVIVGKKETVQLATATLLSRGHLLIEDVPGLGKTILARAIAASLALRFRRIQFTPDLLPSDVTGVSIFNQKSGEFEFKPGPVFTNVLLADEINRATPRTQSSLLESMEELQVTVDGKTYRLPAVFMVVATQNPIELQGTYPLPEAQLDRFFMRISIGYPEADEEVKIMEMQVKKHPIHSVQAVLSDAQLREMQDAVADIHMEPAIKKYIVKIVDATRNHQDVLLGASPRGSLGLMRASQAMAILSGKSYVEPTMVKFVAEPVLAHRIILKPQSRLRGATDKKIIEEILNTIPVPLSE